MVCQRMGLPGDRLAKLEPRLVDTFAGSDTPKLVDQPSLGLVEFQCCSLGLRVDPGRVH